MKIVRFSAMFMLLILSVQSISAQSFAATSLAAGAIKADDAPAKAEDVSPLLIGENIPTLTLQTDDGTSFDLNKAVAAKPTVLVFYRGGWCPYCSLQLQGLMKVEEDLLAMGYQVLAVSTDSPENLAKTKTKEKLNYTLLSDADLTAAKQFGIAFQAPKNYQSFLPKSSGGKNVNSLLPVPAVFLIDQKGIIRFEYINPNFKERMSGEMLKVVAAELSKEMKG